MVEHGLRHDMVNLLVVLSDTFPDQVPHNVDFPNRQWLLMLMTLNKIMRTTNVDQLSLDKEFWQHFQTLLKEFGQHELESIHYLAQDSRRKTYFEYMEKLRQLLAIIDVHDSIEASLAYSANQKDFDTQTLGQLGVTEEVTEAKERSKIELESIFGNFASPDRLSQVLQDKTRALIQNPALAQIKDYLITSILDPSTLLELFIRHRREHVPTIVAPLQILNDQVEQYKGKDFLTDAGLEARLVKVVKAVRESTEEKAFPKYPPVIYIKDEVTFAVNGIKIKNHY